MDTLTTGILLTSTIPDAIKPFYQSLLLSVARPALVFEQLATIKVDPTKGPGEEVIFTRVFDIPETTDPLGEDVAFTTGESLDDEQINIKVQEFGQVIKTSQKLEVTEYLNNGNLAGLVREKLGFGMAKSKNVLARNRLLAGSTHNHYGDGKVSRATILATDKATPDMIEQVGRNMRMRDAIGWDQLDSIACLTNGSVAYDLRKANDWVLAHRYSDLGITSVFNGEIGRYAGTRFSGSTLNRLPNAGAITLQTQIDGATARKAAYITVDDTTGFTAGMEVTIVGELDSVTSLASENDPEWETFVIKYVDAGAKRLYAKKAGVGGQALKKAHTDNAYVVEALDLHPLIFMTPGALGYAEAIAPEVRVAPPIDDYLRINRCAWYGLFDYKVLQDRFCEVWYVAASAAPVE